MATEVNGGSIAGRVVAKAGKTASMLVASRVLGGGSITDARWAGAALATILGFALFDAVVGGVSLRRLPLGPESKEAVLALLRVGTMMVSSRYLLGGDLYDGDWIEEVLLALLGTATFTLVTGRVLGTNKLGQRPGATELIARDWCRVVTTSVVSRVMLQRSLADPAWLKTLLLTLLGFATYDVFVGGLAS